jgi:hypothetical protein
LEAGIAEEDVRNWAENAVAELKDPEEKIYVRYGYAWAVKKAFE